MRNYGSGYSIANSQNVVLQSCTGVKLHGPAANWFAADRVQANVAFEMRSYCFDPHSAVCYRRPISWRINFECVAA